MGYEVELKAHVADHEACKKRLSVLGDGLVPEVKEDVYYSLPGGPALFRIRLEQYGSSQGTLLFTSKEKTIHGGVEVNVEHEFTASGKERDGAMAFARSLGYVEFVRKLKQGVHCHVPFSSFPALHVELVEVPPLGWFVEMEFVLDDQELVEQAKRNLQKALRMLDIDQSAIESRYYMDMLRAPAKQQ
jgi:adenylate cyclase class 2